MEKVQTVNGLTFSGLVKFCIYLLVGYAVLWASFYEKKSEAKSTTTFIKTEVSLQKVNRILDILENNSVPEDYGSGDELAKKVDEGIRKLQGGEIPTLEEITALRWAAHRGQEAKKLLEKLSNFLLGKTKILNAEEEVAEIQGSPVRFLRRSKGLRLVDFCENTGLAISTVSLIECGKAKGSITTWKKIAVGLEVDYEWLIEKNEDFFNFNKK